MVQPDGCTDLPAVVMSVWVALTITAIDNGPGVAHSVVITDEVEPDLQISHVVATKGTAEQDGQTITVNVGSVGHGETITVMITVTATAMGTKLNTAHLTSTKVEQMDSNTVPLEVGWPALPGHYYYLPLVLSSGVSNASGY